MRFLYAAILFFAQGTAHATKQISEVLLAEGQAVELHSNPLESFLQQPGNGAKLSPFVRDVRCTANRLGYVGTWEIRADQLFLVKLVANACETKPTEVPLTALFPGTNGAQRASWYTGRLVVPLGMPKETVQMGYSARYERYRIYTVQEGRVVTREESSVRPSVP